MKVSVISVSVFIFIMFNSLNLSIAWAGEKLTITDLKVSAVNNPTTGTRAKAEVVFNEAFKIKDILLIQAGSIQGLKFPSFISQQGKEYSQVVILERSLYENLLTSISQKKSPSLKTKEELSYRIGEFALTKNLPKLKVLATVIFNDCLQISCKIIQTNQERLWVAWPSRRTGANHWFKQVIFLDKNLKKSIERDLLHRYRSMGE